MNPRRSPTNQPDLNFGFYRITHAKAGQVTRFLEGDLLGIFAEAFGKADEARIAEAKATYEAARKQAQNLARVTRNDRRALRRLSTQLAYCLGCATTRPMESTCQSPPAGETSKTASWPPAFHSDV